MILTELPNELLLIIFSFLQKTKNYLVLRETCQLFNQILQVVPFFHKGERRGNIYLQGNIYWRTLETKRIIKEILFESYGQIRINVYDRRIFNESIQYKLPKTVKKMIYHKTLTRVYEFDLEKNKISTSDITTQVVPMCSIS